MTQLADAIATGKELGKLALYFGCWNSLGHYTHYPDGRSVGCPKRDIPGFPWSLGLMDTGLLKNGPHPDICDGKVFWTCGGLSFWYAFFWWDRSVDKRGAANSGLYVRGFGWPEAQEAFDYACAEFPHVVLRQPNPLILQAPYGTRRILDIPQNKDLRIRCL